MPDFKDNFSKHSDTYAQFRLSYPAGLFEYLSSLTPAHDLVWDCGTGNGQAAVALAEFYTDVFASDPSEAQISNAVAHERVTYKVEKAETPALANASVDLVTVAQAVHWFDFDKFYPEVKRVLKPGGIIAVWAYKYPHVSAALDPVIQDFHNNIVGEFWQPENRMVERRYVDLPFPFEIISTPDFVIEKQWRAEQLIGHLRSWSATQKMISIYGEEKFQQLQSAILTAWNKSAETQQVRWDLTLKAGRYISV